MKLTIGAAHELISNMRDTFLATSPKPNFIYEEPLRAELFSADQMEIYAKKLAGSHELRNSSVRGHLIVRLSDNEKVLNAVRKLLVEAIRAGHAITPAGEWLIDNFYLIEEQIHTATKHLPLGYSESLPQLLNAPDQATTRVYDIALQIISHSDGKIDEERLGSFIRSYQVVTPLKLGELWAIPIMLRLTLIENLRRVAALIAIDRVDQNLAEYWVAQILDIAEKDPKNLILVIGDMAKSKPPMVSAFVSEMTRQLLGKGPALAAVLTWIEQHLNEEGQTIQDFVNAEIQKQSVNQVSVSNSIGSLRLLASIDWRDFVENNSIVEQTLCKDSAGVYAKMDFTTRDNYRHVVENIAKKSDLSENEVATLAIRLSAENFRNEHPYKHKAHVGYFLIGKGQKQTKLEAGVRTPARDSIRSVFEHFRLPVYLGSILLITISISSFLLMKAESATLGKWMLALLAFLLVLASSQLAITVVNFFSTILVKPHLLPRMNFSVDIPDACNTLVIIPSMLTDAAGIEDLVEALEVRFLANRNRNLQFGLLTDFTDAVTETLAVDESLLLIVQNGINALKKKYEDGPEIFYLFHRPRRWNENDKVWMGYERKRGKLSDLNSLLRGAAPDRFSLVIGNLAQLQGVKYIITLDSDTQLPRGTAWKMIATMAHPLNHPVYHTGKKRVTEGYGILQPRVTVSLPEPRSSFYSRLHGNEPGIDPYTRATSDVYQDLFGEGSFIGKGIYELDVFELALRDRFAENSILSHDLLEGCYIRSGLISEVELFEKYPASYRSDMKRRARWIRGDWQIFAWFLPYIHDADLHWQWNPLSALSRWKIFDNIRRSLIPMALTGLIILGWTVLGAPVFWTVAVTSIILFPIFINLLWDAFRKSKEVVLRQHLLVLWRNTRNTVIQTLYTLVCLPYEAYVSSSAIARSIWRILITRKNLLQWNPSSSFEPTNENSLMAAYISMAFAPVLAIAVLLCQCLCKIGNLYTSSPIVLAWGFSPFITWLSSQRLPKERTALSNEQNLFLQTLGRKTWAFFERFVTAADNWLPPDNFQQFPFPVIAHRTSPTNIGLSLLANLTAHDFGYLSVRKLLERTADTVAVLQRMERFKGHFYNWYDTESLAPLIPKFISTVDSGNLAGHLLTLRQGLFELFHEPLISTKPIEGLMDTFRVLYALLNKEERFRLEDFNGMLKAAMEPKHAGLSVTVNNLQRLSACFESAIVSIQPATEAIVTWWIRALSSQLEQALLDIQILSPWFTLPAMPIKFVEFLSLPDQVTLSILKSRVNEVLVAMPAFSSIPASMDETEWLKDFGILLHATHEELATRTNLIEQLGHDCIDLSDMEWQFLYNTSKHLLTVGYKVDEQMSDPGFYDLLASEVRLCVFVIIAQGKLPEDAWFALNRLLTNVEGRSILLSWSGSMFEYLMPLLVMPNYENTLLDQTYKGTVHRQIELGRKRGIPWGVSESGYNMVDANSNYQYRAFGVPGLGIKRGLELDSVIAPYATVLSLMVAPELACKNLELLVADGFEGDYGLYEAVDYTPSRLQRGQKCVIIQSFMAHHQGMSFISMGHLLLGQPMQRRFEAEPQFQATLLLLQERIPKASSFYAHTTHMADLSIPASGTQIRVYTSPDTLIPEVQLLSNNNYHLMLTAAGGGYSRWKHVAITRWREDVTSDNWGAFCYIRDIKTGVYWSTNYQPMHTQGRVFEAAFSQGRVDFHNSNADIEVHTEVVVSPEDDIELRRLKVTNKSVGHRSIEITSYAEVVLTTPASDEIQQAFSNLFVQTEILPEQYAIICSRRPRSAGEQPPWMFHSMVLHGNSSTEVSYETDRMEFIGHGNTIANPQAMTRRGKLGGNQGSVLDPIVSIRHLVELEGGQSITIDLIMGVGDTRTICENLIEKYKDRHHQDRVFELAWTHSQVILRQINATELEEMQFGKLAGSVIYANSALRAPTSVIIKNHRGQSGLWGYSISGDLPIVLLQIEDHSKIELVRQMIKAHTYWRLKGLAVDLVIWNEDHNTYRQIFQNEIQALIPGEMADKPGGIFVRAAYQISIEDRILFQTVARVNISDKISSLEDYLKDELSVKSRIPILRKSRTYVPENTGLNRPDGLLFWNGNGGFSADGREYVIVINNLNRTPLPWVNVIANPNFGTVISESGQAYTWVENAHEMRLTPWNNDIVSDTAGEQFYLRDEDQGHFWSATALPSSGATDYITRHGFGYSSFEHSEDGIYSEMNVFVDADLPIKFSRFSIRNQSGRSRRLSLTGYVEWVMGDSKSKTGMHIITEIDLVSGAFFAKNPYSSDFAHRVAFFDTDEAEKTFTGDRTEFLGRNNSLQHPDAMQRAVLSGKIGVGLDPCAAVRIPIDLADGESRQIIFRLGSGADVKAASDLVTQTRGASFAQEAFEKVQKYWAKTTGAVQIDTPDRALNIIANGWLTYQTVSCRLWARSGYYQSGGAFGFRDQLQDVLSILHTQPSLARTQILLCASRQFEEGDAQHWWHPPNGRGVRTHISDDYLWLPFVTSRYVMHTGDAKILDESQPFLKARILGPDEESFFGLPTESGQSSRLYFHCVRAIKHALYFGIHGLPFMGSGDWNDGMDKVGAGGQGESVWLGFFLYDVLMKFIPIAALHMDPDFASLCKREAEKLQISIEANGWDGAWYRRAYFDNGEPLGSMANTDCQIDSIAQSWSVLSGSGSLERSTMAMEAAFKRLVNKESRLVQLLDPPFDKGPEDPGYIKGYLPGIRENGGQYTHAAIWMAMAFSKLKDAHKVWELLQYINPINHGRTAAEIEVYKAEPYVVAGDVYTLPPHTGRAGWTWYTGSAGWMYQLIMESLLGLFKEGNILRFNPCLPPEWKIVKLQYLYVDTMYHIQIQQKAFFEGISVTSDGMLQTHPEVLLVDDTKSHVIAILIGLSLTESSI